MALTNPRFVSNQRLQSAAINNPSIRRDEPDRAAVAILQKALVDYNFPMPRSTRPDGSMDGGFGAETEKVVKDFQLKNGLATGGVADGIVGQDTMNALDRLAPRTTDGPTPSVPPLGAPPFLFFHPSGGTSPTLHTPPPPPAGATGMNSPHHRRHDRAGHFTAAEMQRHQIEMEIESAARSMGRLHATLMYLARRYNPDVFPRSIPGTGTHWDRIVAASEEQIQDFDEAVANGYILQNSGSSSWLSNVPNLPEFRALERDPHFRETFNETVRLQWTYIHDSNYVEIVLLIVTELLGWGTGRILARPISEAAARASGFAVRTISSVFRGVSNRVRQLLGLLRSRMAQLTQVMTRIVPNRGRRINIHIAGSTPTLRGLGVPQGGGTLPGRGVPQGGGTLPGRGVPQGGGTLRGSGNDPVPGTGGTPQPPAAGGRVVPRDGLRVESMTQTDSDNAMEFVRLREYGPNSGPSMQITSDGMPIEYYDIWWRHWAGAEAAAGRTAPRWGFKVFDENGVLVYISIRR